MALAKPPAEAQRIAETMIADGERSAKLQRPALSVLPKLCARFETGAPRPPEPIRTHSCPQILWTIGQP